MVRWGLTIIILGIALGPLVAGQATAQAPAALPALAPADQIPALRCEGPEGLFVDSSPLPVAAKALRNAHQLKILAIGSLSTKGAGTGPQTSWPARLEAALRQRYPGVQISVANRGRPQLSVADMLERLPKDVEEEHPALVVWESGTMDAVRNTDVDLYRQTLMDGVALLADRRIDTVLMDTQFSRAANAMVDARPYVDAAQQVAEMRDLVTFPRFGLMQYWMESGQLSFDDLKRPLQIKLADRIYDCIGRLLARMITEAVERTPGP